MNGEGSILVIYDAGRELEEAIGRVRKWPEMVPRLLSLVKLVWLLRERLYTGQIVVHFRDGVPLQADEPRVERREL